MTGPQIEQDNGPSQIDVSSKFPTATRVENGVAYDRSGKSLGSVDENQAATQPTQSDDFFAKLGGQPVQPVQNQQQSDDYFAKLGGQEVKPINQPAADASKLLGGNSTMSAAKPGVWDRIKQIVSTGIPALNPDFELASHTEKGTLTGGETPRMQVVTPEAGMTTEEKRQHPVMTGIAETVGGMTSPENALMIAGTAGFGELSAAGKTLVPRLVSAGFSAQMLAGAYNEVPEFKDAIARGDESEAKRIMTHIVLGLGMAAMAGEHARAGEFKPATETGKVLDSGVKDITNAASNVYNQTVKSTVENSARAAVHHEVAKQMYDARLDEVEVARQQAEDAAKKASDARQAVKDGSGTDAQRIEAENNASKAQSNLRKANEAMKDAADARAQASLDVARQQRKLDRSVKTIEPQESKERAGAYEDFVKHSPPTKNNSGNYTPEEWAASRGAVEKYHEEVEDAGTVQGQYDALDHTQKAIEKRVQPYVEKYANEPITTNVKMDVHDALSENPNVEFANKGMKILTDNYDLTDMSVEEADKVRASLNAKMREILGRDRVAIGTALQTNPEFAAYYHAAESIREGEYQVFRDHDVSGIDDIRRDERAVIKVKNAVQKSLGRGSQVVRGSGQSGLIRKTAAKMAEKAGIAIGAGAGASAGGTLGAEGGAVAGGWVGKKIGQMISPADMTRDQLAARHMKVKGAGRDLTKIIGPGTPSNPASFEMPPAPSAAMSQEDITNIRRENSPLHAELASHYGEYVGDRSYGELAQWLREDLDDMKANGVDTRGTPEAKLQQQINQMDAADRLQAQQEAADRAAKQLENPTPTPTYPEETEPVMKVPGMPHQMVPEEGIAHDLAHIVVAKKVGLTPVDGVRSHLHGENVKAGSLMSAPLDLSEFYGEDGKIDPKKVAKRIDDIATTYVAGGVANDLWHDIPFTENHGLGADLTILRRFMKDAGFSERQAGQLIAQAADRAMQILSEPGTREVIEGHAAVREAGLDERYHISKDRMNQILEDLGEKTDEDASRKPTGTNDTGVGPTEGNGPGGKGPSKPKEGNSAGVRQESKGRTEGEGKGSEAATAELQPKLSGATEVAERPKLTHKETDKGGEVRLDTDQEGMQKNRGMLKYTMEGDEARVTGVNLDKDFRGQGLGTEMYEQAAEHARAKGAKALTSDLGGQTSMDAAAVWERLKEKHPGEIEGPFANKVGSPGYRWNLNAEDNNPKLDRPIPKERTTGNADVDDVIKKGGGIPGGVQEGIPGKIKDMAYVHDPITGTSLNFPIDEITPEKVKQALDQKHLEYAKNPADREKYGLNEDGTPAEDLNPKLARAKKTAVEEPVKKAAPVSTKSKIKGDGWLLPDGTFRPNGGTMIHAQTVMEHPEIFGTPSFPQEDPYKTAWRNGNVRVVNYDKEGAHIGFDGVDTPEARKLIINAIKQNPQAYKVDLDFRNPANYTYGAAPESVVNWLKSDTGEKLHEVSKHEDYNPKLSASSEMKDKVSKTPWVEDSKTGYQALRVPGVGELEVSASPGDSYSRIRKSNIEPNLRNQGIGKEMYESAIENVRKMGIPEFKSDTVVSQLARNVWESLIRSGKYDITKEYTNNMNANGGGGVEYTVHLNREQAAMPELPEELYSPKLGYAKKADIEPFKKAVDNTPGAKMNDDGSVTLDLSRYQKPEQAGSTAIRTGVFFTPEEKSPYSRHYTSGKLGYGGKQKVVEKNATLKNPLVIKGATGGIVPERAYDHVVGNGAYQQLQDDVRQNLILGTLRNPGLKEELTYKLLEKYDANPDGAWDLIEHSKQGNQLLMAVLERIAAHRIREAGYDSVLGFSRYKGEPRLSEAFDVSRDQYPEPRHAGLDALGTKRD